MNLHLLRSVPAKSVKFCFLSVLIFALLFFIAVYTSGQLKTGQSIYYTRLATDKVNGRFKTVLSNMLTSSGHRSNKTEMVTRLVARPGDVAKIRLLCFVPTSPKTARSRLQAVQDTWGKRCDVTLYVSSVSNPDMSILGLNVTEGYRELWGKTKAAFQYIYSHHLDDADWFLKADDDTYVVVENLKYMLTGFTPKEPIYFGHRFYVPETNQSYMNGGGGYVISKAGLSRFVENGLHNEELCKKGERGSEDILMGKCLESVGVTHGDSRDKSRRQRFLPHRLEKFLTEPIPRYIVRSEYYPTSSGKECCSDYLVSAHHLDPQDLHVLDYLIYDVKMARSNDTEKEHYYTPSTDIGTGSDGKQF